MTYAEFCELRQKLAETETAYLTAWKACKSNRKRGKQLPRLALELNRLQDEIMRSGWYR